MEQTNLRQTSPIYQTQQYFSLSRAIDGPALPSLNDIGTQQSAPTQAMIADTEWIMDFFHTYPNAHAAYLVMPAAKSRIAGYFFLSADPNPLSYNNAPHNTPILVECHALKNVVCSAAEGECDGLFHNAQNAVIIRNILQALGHPQQATKIKLTTALQIHLYMHQSD
eukprot:6364409-Ditylum_brightwellii.AAC.1